MHQPLLRIWISKGPAMRRFSMAGLSHGPSYDEVLTLEVIVSIDVEVVTCQMQSNTRVEFRDQ